MKTLLDELTDEMLRCKEILRCSEILANAKSIGAPGEFRIPMLRQRLWQAESAVKNGDDVGMVRALAYLRTYSE